MHSFHNKCRFMRMITSQVDKKINKKNKPVFNNQPISTALLWARKVANHLLDRYNLYHQGKDQAAI